MAEISPAVGKFNFYCDFANSEGQKLFSKRAFFAGPHQHENISKMFRVGTSYPLLHLAALNENITFQLCSFSVEKTHKTFTLRVINCQAYVFI